MFLLSAILAIFTKVFPERSGHEPLYELAFAEPAIDFVACKQDDVDVFGAFEMLCRDFPYATCEEGVRQVGHGTGVGRYGEKGFPLSVAVTGFFEEFTPCSFERTGVGGVDDACNEFNECFAKSMAVLAYEHEVLVFRQSDDVDPLGVFEDVEFGVYGAVGQTYGILPHGKPRTAVEILAVEYVPVFVVIGIVHRMTVLDFVALVELPIFALHGEELVVRAVFYDSSTFEHNDLVSVAYGT